VPQPRISLDDRLFLPPATDAILWDLDGTLVDSFQFDLDVCARILSAHAGRPVHIPERLLREGFAMSGTDFWRFLFKSLDVEAPAQALDRALDAAHADWLAGRLEQAFPINEGVREVLAAARAAGLRQAVVSNNPQDEVESILSNSGLRDGFDLVAGNDGSGRAKKPAPDSYLYAAGVLGIEPAKCAAVEDSVLGLRAARGSGAHVIAIASGAEPFATLKASGLADVCYTGLTRCRVEPSPGGPVGVSTPSAEVSALLRGLAGAAEPLDIVWNNDDWHLLGTMLTGTLRPERQVTGATPPSDCS
jgi:HAD superfamily hydrolase (TIGR01509 family)